MKRGNFGKKNYLLSKENVLKDIDNSKDILIFYLNSQSSYEKYSFPKLLIINERAYIFVSALV